METIAYGYRATERTKEWIKSEIIKYFNGNFESYYDELIINELKNNGY